MTLSVLVVEVDVKSYIRRPAVTSRGDLYLISDKKVVGKMRVSSKHNGRVTVEPDDDAAREFLKDWKYQISGYFHGLRFDEYMGYRWFVGEDGNEPQFPDIRVVDCLSFDFGICHAQFHDVEGFDNYHIEQNRLRIHTKHKARRSRNSNKIKKVVLN